MKSIRITGTDPEVVGIDAKADEFAFDGCHKIYILERGRGRDAALDLDYEIRPIEELAETYETSCPLKFIDTWDFRTVVPQFCEGVLTIKTGRKTRMVWSKSRPKQTPYTKEVKNGE